MTNPPSTDPKVIDKVMMGYAYIAMHHTHVTICDSANGAVSIIASPLAKREVICSKTFAPGSLNLYAYAANLVKHTGAKKSNEHYVVVKDPTMGEMTFKCNQPSPPSESNPKAMVNAHAYVKSVHPMLANMQAVEHVENVFQAEVIIPQFTNTKKLTKGEPVQSVHKE